MNTMLLLLMSALGFFAFCIWYRRRKKQAQTPKDKFYVTMASSKDGNREWPYPFESLEKIEAWWDSREDLWEGVDHIEVSKESKTLPFWQ